MNRYFLDDNQRLQFFLDEQTSPTSNGFKESRFSETKLSWLPGLIKDFILPTGFPGIYNARAIFISQLSC